MLVSSSSMSSSAGGFVLSGIFCTSTGIFLGARAACPRSQGQTSAIVPFRVVCRKGGLTGYRPLGDRRGLRSVELDLLALLGRGVLQGGIDGWESTALLHV